ncbi:MAG: hypothetical protein HYS51_00420 [Candidatus Zambryskibacteria bacterium]|nr:hypothetical protein [Candidatus Zambryskibacteria bacterium]
MKTILAMQPENRHVGYAVFEENRLVDWGSKELSRIPLSDRNDKVTAPLFRSLVRRYEPSIVVLPPPAGIPEAFRSQFVRTVREESIEHSIEITAFSREDISECFRSLCKLERVNKEMIMHALVRWFPELKSCLPKPRRPWERQDHSGYQCLTRCRSPLRGFITMTNRDRYWKTRDLFLAAYLFARGATIVGIEANGHEVVFTFIDSLDRQNWHDEYLLLGKPLINVRVYISALETLRQKAIDVLMQSYGRS